MQNAIIKKIEGYKVLFIPTKSKEILIGSLLLTSESEETKNVYGISHLLEHILLHSWNKFPGHSIDSELIKRSIYNNAETHSEFVWYYLLSDLENLDFCIDYSTEIMCRPTFTKQVIDAEKKAIEQELKSYQQDPDTEMEKALYDTLTKDSKSGASSISSNLDMKNLIKNLKNLTATKLKNYYSKVYNSENIVFLICGNEKSEKKVFSRFRKNLKNIPKKKHLDLKFPKTIYTPVTKNTIIHKMRADNVKSTTWLVFSTSQLKGLRNEMLLNLISTVLCSSLGSTLYKIIRVEKNWVYEIECDIDVSPKMELLIIKFTSNTNKVHLIIKEIKNIISSFKLSPVEFKGYSKSMVKQENNGNCTLFEKGCNWAYQWVKYRKLQKVPDVIRNIKKKELENTINKIFNFDKFLLIHQSSHKKVPKNISDLKSI